MKICRDVINMQINELFTILQTATSVSEIERALDTFESTHGQLIQWVPVGGRENNVGTIEGSADPGRSIVERITNGIDAILEKEHEKHNGKPDCRTPREAAFSWMEVPLQGLSELTPTQRRGLSQQIAVKIQAGDGKEARLIEIRDEGIGITPENMRSTILSLNESNKIHKHYVAGMYGQGGSSTFARSKYTLIASRYGTDPRVGFTLVRFEDLDPDTFKSGHYVYLTFKGSVLQTEQTLENFKTGTQVKHFGYDLSNYPSPLGPNSVYGLLNSILFDPILPIWLDNQVHNYRRVIKGSRNALNGAVDDGDENRRGPELAHSMKMFYVNLGDWGTIGIEYWVLVKPEKENRNPIKAYVNPNKPIILTLNGQSHAEYSKLLISKNAELPYLTQRFIGHIDCNKLTPQGKRALFVSNREDARSGVLSDLIQQEFIKALKSDDLLYLLNNEARTENIHQRDETAVQQMRKEVASILKIQGFDPIISSGGAVVGGRDITDPPTPRPHPRRPLKIIEPKEPPTFIRILWKENEEIPFYPGQRRYIRIETDANSNYHDPLDSEKSKINIIPAPGLIKSCGTTPLQGGRMRIIYECASNAALGSTNKIRVELRRSGLPVLFDERPIVIVEQPPSTSPSNQISLPPFELYPIGPDDEMWDTLLWPTEVNDIASSVTKENGILRIFYSTVYPKYSEKLKMFERRDEALAASFTKRYEVWLAAHSLLLEKDKLTNDLDGKNVDFIPTDDSTLSETFEIKERCRIATISTIFAEREVTILSTRPSED